MPAAIHSCFIVHFLRILKLSLHQEVLAQRALDRRLTEELIRFKANVSALTDELEAVKAHDYEVTKHAMQVNVSPWRASKNNPSLSSVTTAENLDRTNFIYTG